MKNKIKFAAACLLISLGTAAQSRAQTLVQPLSVNMVAYDSVANRTITIRTEQFINFLLGTNTPGARLHLVTPSPNAPGTIGALGAFLRITLGSTIIYEVPAVSQFNLYQDISVLQDQGATTHSHALNRFSFDTGAIRGELQGISTWTYWTTPVDGADISGAGAFTSNINGWFNIYNVTHGMVSCSGIIIALRPVPAGS